MVVEKMWPALQSCKHQCYEANDLLSRLPDDLMFNVMSSLTLKEAARTSVLSHRWNYLWRCSPVLIFEDFSAMERMYEEDDEFISRERSSFLKWVNRVLEGHLGRHVNELSVTFDLNKHCQSEMNKWQAFALAKQVKRLELDFSALLSGMFQKSFPKWHLPLDQPPKNSTVFKSCLRSLSLKCVNVTTKDINCLFHSCPVLENLCIRCSKTLRSVTAVGFPLQLKHFEVSHCPRLRTIDIIAPKLLSFVHHDNPVELHIRNASLLSRVSIGVVCGCEDIVTYAFDSLSKYFSQLGYLSLRMQMYARNQQFNLGINYPPALTNLKHLDLRVMALCTQSLFGWAGLIEASPLLERITLKCYLMFYDNYDKRRIMKRNGRPLKSLKALELDYNLGAQIDLEFATYVVENSIMLKEVVVVLRPDSLLNKYSVDDRAAQYKKIVPQGAKLTILRVNNWEEQL